MADYINKQTALDAILAEYPDAHYPEWYAAKIKVLPAADVALVKRAHWIEQDGMQICSNCGEEHTWDDFRAAYCDCCGAKMDSEA